MLDAFLVATAVYVVGMHVYAWRMRLIQVLVVPAYGLPTAVALYMAWLFRIQRTPTVAQFAVGRPATEDMWSGWVRTWPGVLLILAAAGLAHLLASLVLALNPKSHAWLPVTLLGTALCVLGLAAAFAQAPTA